MADESSVGAPEGNLPIIQPFFRADSRNFIEIFQSSPPLLPSPSVDELEALFQRRLKRQISCDNYEYYLAVFLRGLTPETLSLALREAAFSNSKRIFHHAYSRSTSADSNEINLLLATSISRGQDLEIFEVLYVDRRVTSAGIDFTISYAVDREDGVLERLYRDPRLTQTGLDNLLIKGTERGKLDLVTKLLADHIFKSETVDRAINVARQPPIEAALRAYRSAHLSDPPGVPSKETWVGLLDAANLEGDPDTFRVVLRNPQVDFQTIETIAPRVIATSQKEILDILLSDPRFREVVDPGDLSYWAFSLRARGFPEQAEILARMSSEIREARSQAFWADRHRSIS